MDALSFVTSKSVLMMTMEEVGQYTLLLCHSWIEEKDATLADDPEYLARLLRIPAISPRVLEQFEKVPCEIGDEPRIRNKRLHEEWLLAKKRSEDGAKSARKRWDANADPLGSHKEPNTHTIPYHTNKEQNNTSNEFDFCPAESPKHSSAIRFKGDSPIKEVWDYYLQQTEKNAALYTMTPKRHQMGLKRHTEALKKVGGRKTEAVVLMKCAIDAMVASDFHQGRNDAKKKYNDWELLFRSADKFEQWLERANQ